MEHEVSPSMAARLGAIRGTWVGKSGQPGLRKLPQNNPNPVIQVDPKGSVRFYNSGAQKLFQALNLSDVGELLAPVFQSESDFLPPPQKTRIAEVDYPGNRVFRWHLVYEEEEVIDCFGFETTDLHQCEMALVQSQRLEWIGQTAASIAHDFNNYLATIGLAIGMANRAARQENASKTYSYLDAAMGATEQAVILSRRLSNFGREKEGNVQSFQLSDFMSERENLFRTIFDRQMLFTIHSSGKGAISADPFLLEQVVMNLLVNARDAIAEREGIRGEVNISWEEDSQGGVALAIEDNGIGMTEQTMEKIFDPFYTTKPEGKGSGLGMYAVKAILDRMSARISIHSSPNRGCRMRITFPGGG